MRTLELVALALGAVVLGACRREPHPNTHPMEEPSRSYTLTAGEMTPIPTATGAPDVPALVTRVSPAVVSVTTTQQAKAPRGLRDWPFGGIFGDGIRPPERHALGSGFVIDKRGYVVTNAHVVADADSVKVAFTDEKELDAKVRGRDERLDVAVLELQGVTGDLPTVTLGSSDALHVGEWVVAIGNPFALGSTVTLGIVSAKSRAIGAGPYDDFVQTDASINPGNSGGPLFDAHGFVVGMNTAMAAQAQGIGFAIPSDAIKDVVPQLVTKGRVDRGMLGVTIALLDAEKAKALGVAKARGALVADVQRGGAADRAGIRPNDVIVAVDGVEVHHATDLPRLVARRPPGSRARVDVLRGARRLPFEVTLDALKEQRP
jgi:serine protease Do